MIRLFAGDRIFTILDKLGPSDGEPIEHGMLTKRIEGAQKKVEEFHFVNRKNVVKYDDVLNEQRKQVYARRQEILRGDDIREEVMQWMWDVIEAASRPTPRATTPRTGTGTGCGWRSTPSTRCACRCEMTRAALAGGADRDHLRRRRRVLRGARAAWGEELTRNIERWITLQVTDTRWREHLDNMDYMRQGIGLRGYAQKDPLVEYRREGQEMFDEMEFLIEQEVVRALMHAEVEVEPGEVRAAPPRRADRPPGNLSYEHADAAGLELLAASEPGGDEEADELFPVVEQRRVDVPRNLSRNEPCWCGSGKKYKRCHGA